MLRRYLALDPKSVRGREMLAWALEAGGDLDGELEVRRSLSDDLPDARPRPRLRARARTRRELRGRARSVQARARRGGRDADATLATSYQRMLLSHHARAGGRRLAPVRSAGVGLARAGRRARCRSERATASACSPGTTRRTTGTRTRSSARTCSRRRGTVTGLGAQLLLGRRAETSLLLGADARYATEAGVDSNGVEQLSGHERLSLRRAGRRRPRTSGSTRTSTCTATSNEQWNEAPITVHEGGTMTGATGHLYPVPEEPRRAVRRRRAGAAAAAHARRATPEPPKANQLLVWGGVDFNLWAQSARVVRAEALDERLVRRTYLNDAGVLAYRHYELVTRRRSPTSASRSRRARRSTTAR